MTGDGLPKYERWEREQYPVNGWQQQERCWSCDKPHDPDKLVRTLDGPECFECLEVSRSEAEAELKQIDGAAAMKAAHPLRGKV